MRALVQRVSCASVTVDGEVVGKIGPGLLVLTCAMGGRSARGRFEARGKGAKLRIFSDDEGRMNRSLLDVGGEALVVPSSRWPRIRLAAIDRASLPPHRPRREARVAEFAADIRKSRRSGRGRTFRCRHEGRPNELMPGHDLARHRCVRTAGTGRSAAFGSHGCDRSGPGTFRPFPSLS